MTLPLPPNQTQAALMLWAISWMPGLFLFAYRLSRLVPAGQRRRAAGEGLVISALPLAAWAMYALSDATAHAEAQARIHLGQTAAPVMTLQLAWSVGQVLLPYLVVGAFAGWRAQRQASSSKRLQQPAAAPGPWWLAAAVAMASIPFLTPGLFMAQLMLVFGG